MEVDQEIEPVDTASAGDDDMIVNVPVRKRSPLIQRTADRILPSETIPRLSFPLHDEKMVANGTDHSGSGDVQQADWSELLATIPEPTLNGTHSEEKLPNEPQRVGKRAIVFEFSESTTDRWLLPRESILQLHDGKRKTAAQDLKPAFANICTMFPSLDTSEDCNGQSHHQTSRRTD